MKRLALITAALLVAMTPAALGLWGNASFSQAVPVQVPERGQVVTVTVPAPTASSRTASSSPTAPTGRVTRTGDDHGGDVPREQRTEPGDDRDRQGAVSTTAPRPSASTATTEADDHGGDVPRDQRSEPGDDRDSGRTDDDSSGSGHGSDDSGHGSDDSGHGSDDSGSEGSGDDD
jgi:hypothetical protein